MYFTKPTHTHTHPRITHHNGIYRLQRRLGPTGAFLPPSASSSPVLKQGQDAETLGLMGLIVLKCFHKPNLNRITGWLQNCRNITGVSWNSGKSRFLDIINEMFYG